MKKQTLNFTVNDQPEAIEITPRIREIGKRTLSVCRKNSAHFGILTLQEETLAYWKEQGAQFFAVGTDALFLIKSSWKSLGLWEKYSA